MATNTKTADLCGVWCAQFTELTVESWEIMIYFTLNTFF